jgi:hypothetical protein
MEVVEHLRLPGGVLDTGPHLALVRRELVDDGTYPDSRDEPPPVSAP